jgi:poly-gamma-glutamate synthesis protein (capsule biosynthesis protein)
MESSGVPPEWAAGRGVPGVNFLEDLGPRSLERVAAGIARHKTRRDIAVLSIHWGDNWGHGITAAEQAFAHGLVDGAGVDVVHGHSSHHPKAIEVHGGRPILYGCGDFLNDYEGIGGWEVFRPELTAMYFATLDAPGGVLRRLDVVPMRIRHLRVERASRDDALWLARTLSREGRRFGTRVEAGPDAGFALRWSFAQEGLGAPG